MLEKFLGEYRNEIINRCRQKVARRAATAPARSDVEHGVPVFLDQLGAELRRGMANDAPPDPQISATATAHGNDLMLRGFTASQVVHDYGDVCQSITELSIEKQAHISADDFRMLNKCLDDAIAAAITEHGRAGTLAANETAVLKEHRFGLLANGLRASLHSAVTAFEIMRTGRIGLGGSTGALLERSLQGAQHLNERLIFEIAKPGSPAAAAEG